MFISVGLAQRQSELDHWPPRALSHDRHHWNPVCQLCDVRNGSWSCKNAAGDDGPEVMGRFGTASHLPHTPMAASSGLTPMMFMTRVRL